MFFAHTILIKPQHFKVWLILKFDSTVFKNVRLFLKSKSFWEQKSSRDEACLQFPRNWHERLRNVNSGKITRNTISFLLVCGSWIIVKRPTANHIFVASFQIVTEPIETSCCSVIEICVVLKHQEIKILRAPRGTCKDRPNKWLLKPLG